MENLKDVLELLKDDTQYYRGIGKDYLSNSDIGTLLSNPRLYGKEREDSKAFMEGRYFHQLILEPSKAKDLMFVDCSTRTTKIYKEFCETNSLPFCMLQKEKEDVEELVSVIKANITFYEEIFKEGNQYEVPAVTEIHGMMWKGKADIVTNEIIIDLKTTSDIEKFKWNAKKYNYDSQCYIYQMLFGKPLVFFVIDKTSQVLGIFRPTQEFVDGGEQKVIKAIEAYNRYFSVNSKEDIDSYFVDEYLF